MNPNISAYCVCVHNPCPSACPRVLRDRLIALLEDADDAWATHRRPWRKLGAGTMRAEARGLRRRRATRNSGTRHIPNGSHEQGSSSSKLADLDSGAGPRKFWQTVAGHKFVEASWNIDIEVGRCFERGGHWSMNRMLRVTPATRPVGVQRRRRRRMVGVVCLRSCAVESHGGS